MPHGGGQNDVGVVGMDDDPSDAAAFSETHVLPGLASIDGLVDPITNGDVAADKGLTGAGPHDLGVGRCDGERADGLGRLARRRRVPR